MSLPIPAAHQSFYSTTENYPKSSSKEKMFAKGILPAMTVLPQNCCSQGASTQSGGYVYTVGSIDPLFPSLSVEKEFQQAMEKEDLGNGITRDQLFKVFSKKNEDGRYENLYIARQMVWLFKARGLDLYILTPDSDETLEAFINSLDSTTESLPLQAIVGVQLPVTGEMPQGDTSLPVVVCRQIFTIDNQKIIKNIQDTVTKIKATTPSVEEATTVLLKPMMELAQNPGHTDSERAINYTLIRSSGTYSALWQMINGGMATGPKDSAGFSLHNVDSSPSSIQGSGMAYDVIFSFRGNSTNLPVKLYCRVDVKGQFPYLLSEMERYFGVV